MENEPKIPQAEVANNAGGESKVGKANPDGTIPFDSLLSFIGQKVQFRDPYGDKNSDENPYFKVGRLEDRHGQVALVVDGHRPIIILLENQDVLDRYQVKLGAR